MPVTAEKTEKINLTMDKEAAVFLRDVMELISGDPNQTRRSYGEEMNLALAKCGVGWSDKSDLKGAIDCLT